MTASRDPMYYDFIDAARLVGLAASKMEPAAVREMMTLPDKEYHTLVRELERAMLKLMGWEYRTNERKRN